METGRNTYNEAVATSSRQQILINIVRVHRNENPVFVDIPEIDASSQLQLSATSALTNIGGHPGTIGGTLEGAAGAVGAGSSIKKRPRPSATNLSRGGLCSPKYLLQSR